MGGLAALPAYAVGLDAQGQIEFFAVGLDGNLWVIQQTSPNNGWSGWLSLGALPGPAFASAFIVAANGVGPVKGPGRLEIFVTGSDGRLWHNWQIIPGQWSGWASLGGSIVGTPGVGKNSDNGGRLELFAKGTDSALWHIWQMPPTSQTWSAFNSLGGQVNSDGGPPVVGLNSGNGPLNNCLQVFVFANPDPFTSHYDYLVQQSQGAGPWSPWTSFGGWQGAGCSVGQNQDGRLEFFAVGQDALSGDNLAHNWQTGAGTNSWSGWNSLGNPPAGTITPCVAQNQDGRLEVFGLGLDGALWHIWQTSPNNGWSGWDTLGAPGPGVPIPGPNCCVSNNQDGRLEVFVIGADASLWHIWQTSPNNGWSGWASLGQPA